MHTGKPISSLLMLLILQINWQPITSNDTLMAQTQQGIYIGRQVTINGTNVSYWYGIPYAQQPIGNLRWVPPQALPMSNNTMNAYIPNACPQASNPGISVNESCLTLNVYAPSNASNLPVFVWIHGGSFTSGAGAQYNAAPFVSTSIIGFVPVVVVTINYRLGFFGFLADEELYNEGSASNNKSTTGNYGILDQIMALNWIKENIGGFGGNPNEITIGGESAGGISVNILLTSSVVTTGTFQKAIVQSGSIWPDSVSILQSAINSTGNFLRNKVNCTTVLCLRNITVSQILEVQNILASQSLFGISASPVIDGYVLTDTMEDNYVKGYFQKVPLLVGSNTNETSVFTCPFFNSTATVSQVQAFFNRVYGSSITNKIPTVYGPISAYDNPLSYLNTVFSDSWGHCGSRRVASTFSSYSLPSYFYTYNHLLSAAPSCYGVAHAAELPMFFRSVLLDLYPNYNFTTSEQQLSQHMILYWANFIHNSNPNYNGDPETWTTYQTSSDNDLVIDVNSQMRNHYYNATCSGLWDKYAPMSSGQASYNLSFLLIIIIFIYHFIF